jgi:predicted secreted hydrolase
MSTEPNQNSDEMSTANKSISASPGKNDPIPPSQSVIQLPKDHYLHIGAPTEWWWHTGTLKSGSRTFGFEINASSLKLNSSGNSPTPFGLTQVMLTDVSNGCHFENTSGYPINPDTWAEHDPSKDWSVELGNVSMHAPQVEPTDMTVKARFEDADTGTIVQFDLRLTQNGPPFIVWGTGVLPDSPRPPQLDTNNFYYSLTRLRASGKVVIGNEILDVTGVTWMDHEYGLFSDSHGNAPKWVLQDIQLDNGVCLSNYMVFSPGQTMELNKRVSSQVTVQTKNLDGTYSNYFVESFLTPYGRTWKSPKTQGNYFMQLKIEVPAFNATLDVSSLLDCQEFAISESPNNSIYEGVATATGSFDGKDVQGTAWIEQCYL